MTAENEGFPLHLPVLLRLFANPTTPHTALEFCCRIRSFGWVVCERVLMAELEASAGDVKRLILGIISEEAEQIGTDSVQSFVPQVVSSLKDEDRLVRMAAIHAVESLRVYDQNVVVALRNIIANDEPIVASQALATLLELDVDCKVLEKVAVHFRDGSH